MRSKVKMCPRGYIFGNVDPQLPIDLGGGEAVGNNAVFMMAYLRPPKK
jgi:hypothetical protein